MLIKKVSGAEDRKVLEAGSYPAVVRAIYELGTQAFEYDGKFTGNFPKAWIEYEIHDEAEMYYLGRGYKISGHEKAALFKDFGWLQIFEAGFELGDLLNIPGLLNVEQYKKPNGDIANKITSFGRCPKGFVIPKLAKEACYYSIEDLPSIPVDAPEFIQNMIRESLEYKELQRGAQ